MMKADKQSQGARVLHKDEKFGSDRVEEKKQEEVTMVRYPPGYIPPEPKKKKQKKPKKKKEDGEIEGGAEDKEEVKP